MAARGCHEDDAVDLFFIVLFTLQLFWGIEEEHSMVLFTQIMWKSCKKISKIKFIRSGVNFYGLDFKTN